MLLAQKNNMTIEVYDGRLIYLQGKHFGYALCINSLRVVWRKSEGVGLFVFIYNHGRELLKVLLRLFHKGSLIYSSTVINNSNEFLKKSKLNFYLLGY